MIEIANQAVENMAKIKIISEEMGAVTKATENELYRLQYDYYRPKIQALEHERDLKLEDARKQGEAAENVKRSEIERLNEVVFTVRRILDFLRLNPPRNLDISDEDIQLYERHDNRYKESLGFYIDDVYLKVKLFILGNEKPVNKYSLVALGKCLFNEDLLKLDRNYGMPFHTSERYELEKVLKDFPTVEMAKVWIEKNTGKLLSEESMAKYREVKAAYDKAIQTYKVDDFQEFLLARCECGVFYTIWEDWVKRDGEVCRRCDKPMTLYPREISSLL